MGKTLQFGLVAENVVSIRYFFYSHRRECNSVSFFPQHGEEHSLLAEVYLGEAYQFGEVWGWEAVFENAGEVLLAYLIQIIKNPHKGGFFIGLICYITW